MFRHILVPVDDHPASAQAARHAFDLTRALGGRVTLLHLLERDVASAHDAASRRLGALAASARRPPAQVILPVSGHAVQQAIVSYALQHGVDLIVLGVGGQGGLTDQALGRLGAELARISGLPVHLAASPQAGCSAVSRRWQQVLGDLSGPPPRS